MAAGGDPPLQSGVVSESAADRAGPNPLLALVLPVYLPAFLLATGSGAMSTFLPLFYTHLGTTVAQAALLVGVGTAGVLVFDLPSGFVVARYGERRVLVVSGVGIVVAALVIALSPGPGVATVGVFLSHAAASFWLLGRLEFVRKALSTSARGRGLATVGGVMRAGLFLGPVLGGVAARAAGYRVVFLGTAALGLLSRVFFLAAPGTRKERRERLPWAAHARQPFWDAGAIRKVLRDRGRVLATAGLSMTILALLRSGRALVLPLWGQAIGLDAAGVGLVVGLSSASDTLMFYPAGLVSDRRGRKWSAVLCLVTLSAGVALIPLTHNLVSLLLVALAVGLGNGMGSGINMTLGADFASGTESGVFLGLWRLVTDVGAALAPLVVGVVTLSVALGPAALVLAGLGMAGGVFHAAAVPETLRRPARE